MRKLFKVFFACVIICLSYNLYVKTNAADAYFVWEKTEIEVPVFSDINDYKNKYVVKLYVGGVESDDFYVTMEVNTSSFSTVLTNKVGRYTVYYKAYSKNNYISSTQAIVFNVVDKNPPTVILENQTIKIECGQTISSLNVFEIYDDTCKNNELKVYIDDSNVLYNHVGVYNAKVIVEDLYKNKTEKNFYVEVIDTQKPRITVIKTLIFNYGEKINLEEYFKCIDDVYGDITDLIEIEGLDENVLGRQQIKVAVTDYSGNYTSLILEAMVVDKVPPSLVLLESEITLDILEFNLYNVNFFEKYIYLINDNYTKKDELILKINTVELKKEVADFKVYFTLIDENGNKTEKYILVRIRELVGPQLLVDDIIYLKLGDERDLLSFAEAYDDYDDKVGERILIDKGNFDINVAGEYIVIYKCFNTSGIYTEKPVTIIVGDSNKKNENSPKEDTDFVGIVITISIIVITVFGVYTFVVIRKRLKRKSNSTRV